MSAGAIAIPTVAPSLESVEKKEDKKEPAKEINYSYTKTRREFGRQERSLQDHFRIHANVKPLQKYRKLVIKKTIVDKDVQAAPGASFSEMNTMRAEFKEFSVMHEEGGWPKDINMNDPEMIQRHRKKLEKEDAFATAVTSMTDEMEELIKNNNTINFYRNNYECEAIVAPDRDLVPSATVISVYKNPAARPRRVSRITFAPDNIGRMAVAQCPFEFDPVLREHTGEAFFWEIENPTRPEGMIRAGSLITDVRYHPKDLHCIIGALFTGQVAVWDARIGPTPQLVSSYDVSHTDVCTTALWINSKTGCEFMSGGMDGQVIWWDERKLSETLDTLWCDPEKGVMRQEMAQGATVLEYEHTLPTKFLAGTDRGNIMVFMKKGKSPSERMIHLYKAHKGPVMACHRNPMFIKNFLTVGDYHLRVFAEDCKDSAIMWTVPTDVRYTDANWLVNRPSCFMACRTDGIIEWWDLLVRGANNILQMKVCEEALTAVCAADTGRFVAVGSIHGDVRFIQLSHAMGDFDKGEKPALALVFDRESRREKYLEQRYREIRLKKRDQEKQEAIQKKQEEEEAAEREELGFPGTEGMDPLQVRAMKVRMEVIKNPIVNAERDFFYQIAEEIAERGIDAFPDKKVVKKAKGGQDDDEASARESQAINLEDLSNLDLDDNPEDLNPTAEGPDGSTATPSALPEGAVPSESNASQIAKPPLPSKTPSAAPSTSTTAPQGDGEEEDDEEEGGEEEETEKVKDAAPPTSTEGEEEAEEEDAEETQPEKAPTTATTDAGDEDEGAEVEDGEEADDEEE